MLLLNKKKNMERLQPDRYEAYQPSPYRDGDMLNGLLEEDWSPDPGILYDAREPVETGEAKKLLKNEAYGEALAANMLDPGLPLPRLKFDLPSDQDIEVIQEYESKEDFAMHRDEWDKFYELIRPAQERVSIGNLLFTVAELLNNERIPSTIDNGIKKISLTIDESGQIEQLDRKLGEWRSTDGEDAISIQEKDGVIVLGYREHGTYGANFHKSSNLNGVFNHAQAIFDLSKQQVIWSEGGKPINDYNSNANKMNRILTGIIDKYFEYQVYEPLGWSPDKDQS
jgi:hypothetical protein